MTIRSQGWSLVVAGMLVALPVAGSADASSCYNIQDADKRAFCLGSAKRETSYCYNIRDMDWRNYCLTLADGQRSHCYNIRAQDLRNQCLAGATK